MDKTTQIFMNKCTLCLLEKLEILKYPDAEELLNNKRSEIMSRCLHQGK